MPPRRPGVSGRAVSGGVGEFALFFSGGLPIVAAMTRTLHIPATLGARCAGSAHVLNLRGLLLLSCL
ncbi:hypothetical protein SAMN05878426_10541 [Phaeovulum vinaykumarii]|uniref:Uncharacterized protein n=1 Tax=Phaeovulum vinaykumarii TaxID=407234 RepID=A0A1N7M3Z4_9RHOB|nr:hypothetical protein SAMN05421795_105161 [Phaeovulum vinaykumarii]SOC08929.1 hypothetical protein SAMN05878426_10541 [Phaeovulum vinaykumarii]